jgi:hypothetical protein
MKKVNPKDYEPPDRPLTKLNTRREVLLLLAEGGTDIVRDLFDCCLYPFGSHPLTQSFSHLLNIPIAV